PWGLLLAASISASLMSNLASGPERIDSAAGAVVPPQGTTNHSASIARTTTTLRRIVLPPLGVSPTQKQKGALAPLPLLLRKIVRMRLQLLVRCVNPSP